MTEIRGIKNGALLQRNDDDLCEIRLYADFAGTPAASCGELTPNGDGSWTLSGILAGGPYTVTLSDDQGSVTFTDIYVGDLWLLAGQSNMEGNGWMTAEDMRDAATPSPLVRAYYMYDEWGAARPQLHHLYLSPDAVHRDRWRDMTENRAGRGLRISDLPPNERKRCVGPGLAFAREMFALTGVPQGVIPAAVGGTPIGMWVPAADGAENYYTAACRRLTETGSHIRGVFWSQGEGNPNADEYPAQIESIRADLCRRLRVPVMPWVQMQSFKYTKELGREGEEIWTRFREMQRRMPEQTAMLEMIATNDLENDDCIHLSSGSQRIAGRRAARAMYTMITGRGTPEMRLSRVYAERDRFVSIYSEVHFAFDHVSGALRANGVPSGIVFRRRGSGERPDIMALRRLLVSHNEVIARLEIPLEELPEYEFWYGYGNRFYCNITDEAGRAIPAMGPVTL